MKKAIAILALVMLIITVPMSADADGEEFEALWLVDMPREVYFIGETMTVTLLAYASTDTTLFLPGEMCLVTIRNQSLAETFSAWLTTNSNGTILVTWDIPLSSDVGNYTLTVAPIMGDNIIKPFIVLYDENTYWQKRVENLEDELNLQYEYLNYLYGTTNYLKRQVQIMKDRMFISGAVMLITILACMWVVLPEWAKRANAPGMKQTVSSTLAKLMGFTNTPKVLLTDQHEELAQLKTPFDRRPPRYGLTEYCSLCDPDKKEPMTKWAYEQHITSHYRRTTNLRAWRRNRVYKQLIRDHYELPEKITDHEKIIRADNRRDELIESVELSKKELKAIESERENLLEKAKQERRESKAEKKAKKQEKKLALNPKRKVRVHKPAPIQKAVSTRKVREVKRISGIPAPRMEPVPKRTTAIDDLFEKLSSEKVN